MIMSVPAGWAFSHDAVDGRHYAEDGTDIEMVYKFVPAPPNLNRVISVTENGSPPSDVDTNRCLAAFGFEAATEANAGDLGRTARVFHLEGPPL